MQLRFVTSESAFDYFRTTRAYLEEHGKPVAFYSDKHGIFRVNSKEAAVEGAGTTPRCCRGSDLIDRCRQPTIWTRSWPGGRSAR